MSHLADLIRDVSAELHILRHPLADEDLSVRYPYACAVAAAAYAEGVNEDAEARVERFLRGLLLPEGQLEGVRRSAKTPGKDLLRTAVSALPALLHQLLLVLDVRSRGAKGAAAADLADAFLSLFQWRAEDRETWGRLLPAVLDGNWPALLAALGGVPGCPPERRAALAAYLLPDGAKARSRLLDDEIGRLASRVPQERGALGPKPEPKYFLFGEEISEARLNEEYAFLSRMFGGSFFPTKDMSQVDAWESRKRELDDLEKQLASLTAERDCLRAALNNLYVPVT